MLKKNRLFFKDFDGSLIEVPQKKVFVRTKELKQIKRQNTGGGVSVYGDDMPEVNELCKNTNHWVRHHRAIGTLQNEEDGVNPFPELEKGEGSIAEEGDQYHELPAQINSLKREQTQLESARHNKPDGEMIDSATLSIAMRGRNKSLYVPAQTADNHNQLITPRSEPESVGLLD